MSLFQCAEKHGDDCSLIDCVWCLVRAAQAQCQQGWRENEGTCYFFSSEEKTWFEAQSYCLEQHSNLLSIRNIHEIVRMTAAHPFRGCGRWGVVHSMSSWHIFLFLPLFFWGGKKMFPAVAEDASRLWGLLDGSERLRRRRCLGVERRDHLPWVHLVRAPLPPTPHTPHCSSNAGGGYCIWKNIDT